MGAVTSTAVLPGVTGDSIKVVIYYEQYEQGVQQVLAANELAMTPAQAEELHNIYEEFFNTHYELYGRKLEVVPMDNGGRGLVSRSHWTTASGPRFASSSSKSATAHISRKMLAPSRQITSTAENHWSPPASRVAVPSKPTGLSMNATGRR